MTLEEYNKKKDHLLDEYDELQSDLKKQYHIGMLTLDEYTEELSKASDDFVKKNNQLDAEYDASQQQAAGGSGVASPAPLTDYEAHDIKVKLIDKYYDGDITYEEYQQAINILNDAKKSGKTMEEAMVATGLKQAQAPSATPAQPPLTDAQYDKLQDALLGMYNKGEITYSEWTNAMSKVADLMVYGGTAEQVIEAAEKSTGQTLPKALTDDLTGKAAQPAAAGQPITQEQFSKISDEVFNLAMNDKITFDEYVKATNKLNALNAAGGFTLEQAIEETEKITGALPDDLKNSLGVTQAASTGPDPGEAAKQQAIDDLESELAKVYSKAAAELKAQLQEFTDKYGAKLAEKQAQLLSGEITQADYLTWVNGQLEIQKLLQSKIDMMSESMLHANEKAMAMVNGDRYKVFAENANYQSYQITQDTGLNLSFAIYDEDTVERLIKYKPELLPRREVNGVKDQAWNQHIIAQAVTQAILQGDSIPDLARRIALDTASENGKSMLRYARTAMTGAQNAGRMEMLHRAKGMGIKCKKKWLATLDGRTRDSHRAMDGVTVDVDEKFKTPLGSEMDYPGDMSGNVQQADIWNCRCTMVYEYEDYPDEITAEDRIQYDDYFTMEKGKDGKKHKVYHRAGSSLITDMNYNEWKAAKGGGLLNDLNLAKVELAEAQKQFIQKKVKEDKVYKDLWKDPVKLEDYPAKAAGIAAKRDYYDQEIDKLKDAIANGASWASPDKLKELQKKRKLLDEFEQNGQLLQKRNEALKKVQDIYDQVGLQKTAAGPAIADPDAIKKAKAAATKAKNKAAGTTGKAAKKAAQAAKKGQFAPDSWDAKAKKAARDFATKEQADKVIRPELDAMWDTLTEEEKYGVWLYTWNSNPMNRSLSGYHDGWDRSRKFVGIENAEWGHEDDYANRDISGLGEMGRFARADGHAEYLKGVTYCTKAIEKSELQEGQWLVRGSDENGLAGWFDGAGMDFYDVTKLFSGGYSEADMKAALVGKKAKNHAFTSTGIARDAGFDGNVKYRIYAPKGTKGIYAEPQSHYGETTGDIYGVPRSRIDKIYKKGESYSSVGREAEIIVQRGTTYICTGLKITGYDWRGKPEIEIEMEIVEQPDYFSHGDEDTYNDGKTRHKK